MCIQIRRLTEVSLSGFTLFFKQDTFWFSMAMVRFSAVSCESAFSVSELAYLFVSVDPCDAILYFNSILLFACVIVCVPMSLPHVSSSLFVAISGHMHLLGAYVQLTIAKIYLKPKVTLHG